MEIGKRICRLCLETCENFQAVEANTFDVLDKIPLKINLAVSEEPVMCTSCAESLMSSRSSEEGSNTLEVIKQCKTFCEDEENTDDEVKFSNGSLMEVEEQKFNCVQQFVSNNTLICKEEGNEADTEGTIYMEKDIKIEPKNENFEEPGDPEFIKVNESLMKVEDQKLNSVQQFKSELEDKKCLIAEEIEIKAEPNDFNSSQVEDSSPQLGVGNQSHRCCGSLSKQYQCESCDVVGHKNHSEITMYQCESCDFKTKRKQSLQVHMLIHKDPSEITMYQCYSCDYVTKFKGCLRTHIALHQDPSEVTMHKCSCCSFQTRRKGNLRSHMITHKPPHETEIYQCGSCSYKASQKCYLHRHMLKHKDPSEVTMHKCGSCSYQTKRKGNLQKHMLTNKHSSEIAIHQCEFCLFKTKGKRHLLKHMLMSHKNPSKMTVPVRVGNYNSGL